MASGNPDPTDVAIGELLTDADDTCRPIISAYSHSSNHGKNVTALSGSKFSADSLETCANFLGLKTRDENENKIYSNKRTLADRIVLMIESFFESNCAECSQKYRVKLQDKPKFRCFLCFQGSHDCEKFTNLSTPTKDISSLTGNVWICSGCYVKNDPLAPNKTRKRTDSGSAANSVNFDENIVQLSANENTTEEKVTPDELATMNSSNSPVCQLYLKNACPHGTSGKKEVDGHECSNFHPKRCYRFVKEGPRSKFGCQKGKKCDFFHPILCRYSVRNRRCTNKECTFVHLRGTKRWPESEDKPPKSGQARPRKDDPSLERQTRTRSNFVPEENSTSERSRSGINPSGSNQRRQQEEKEEKPLNNGDIVRLIQDIRGDFQRELELMRAQMFFIKQPAPPPWVTQSHFRPPQVEQANVHPNPNNSQLENQNTMHQIPQRPLPLYRDALLRQHSCS